jgi:hypothetical protein
LSSNATIDGSARHEPHRGEKPVELNTLTDDQTFDAVFAVPSIHGVPELEVEVHRLPATTASPDFDDPSEGGSPVELREDWP